MYYIMQLIVEAAIAAALFGVALTIFCAARRVFSKPGPVTDGAELFTVIAATGRAEQLEQTVNGLRRNNARIIIADCGLDAHIKTMAGLISQDDARVTVCSPRELPLVLEENGWTGDEIISS